MALLKSSEKTRKKQLRINIQESIADEAKTYCDWANISQLDDFFEQAAQYIFKKDKEWKQYKSCRK